MQRSNNTREPSDRGLRARMRAEERRISSQHRQLDDLFDLVAESIEKQGVHVAGDAFRRFADALEAHLSLEESIYFPALHGLRPDLGAELTALVDEHDSLRRAGEEVRALLDAGERETSSERFDAFGDLIADHEAREEELIARIGTAPVASLGRTSLSD